MTARLLLLLVLGVALAVMPAVAFGDSARHLKNSTTYPDSIGEDAAAPDITSVTVSNDDAGMITFQVTVSNRPALTQDMEFLVLLDIDKNASTGAAAFLGADYVIDLISGSVDLFHWNGSAWTLQYEFKAYIMVGILGIIAYGVGRWFSTVAALGIIALNAMHAHPRTVHQAPRSRDQLSVAY